MTGKPLAVWPTSFCSGSTVMLLDCGSQPTKKPQSTQIDAKNLPVTDGLAVVLLFSFANVIVLSKIANSPVIFSSKPSYFIVRFPKRYLSRLGSPTILWFRCSAIIRYLYLLVFSPS